MITIRMSQRCEPGCKQNQKIVADLREILGFGTLGKSGGLFVTDGDKRVCLDEICPVCGQSITYVTNTMIGGEKDVV